MIANFTFIWSWFLMNSLNMYVQNIFSRKRFSTQWAFKWLFLNFLGLSLMPVRLLFMLWIFFNYTNKVLFPIMSYPDMIVQVTISTKYGISYAAFKTFLSLMYVQFIFTFKPCITDITFVFLPIMNRWNVEHKVRF